MRRSKQGIGASPAISATLLLAIVVAGFTIVSFSSFEFFRAMIDETADAELEFEEEGDNKIVITLLENQNVNYVDIIMANGDVYKFDEAGESKRITIEQSGNIKAIGEVSDTGSRQLIRTYSPRNIRAIEGTVSYNPPAEGVTVKIERAGRVIVTQETNEKGEFGLVPSSDGSYDVHIEEIEDVKTLIGPGTKNVDIVLDQDVIGKTDSSSSTVADLMMEGAGTRDDPYVITNPSELQATRTDKDAYYIIREDIDASITQTAEWDPGFDYIGTDNDKFNGTIEVPNSVTIENIRMANTDAAIFENITGTASVNDDNLVATDSDGNEVDVVANAILNYNFPSSVVEGKKIRGSVTVGDSGELTVEVPGVGKKTKKVNLGGKNQKTINFKINTKNKERGSYNINIQLDDDLRTTPIDIILPEQANETVVANFNTPDYVSNSSDSLEISVEILNAGNSTIQGRDVTIDLGGIEATAVTRQLNSLEPNESQVLTEVFTLQSSDESKQYQVSITGVNVSATDTYRIIDEPAGFIVNSTRVLDSYSEGDQVTVRSEIINTASSANSNSIEFGIDSLSISESAQLQLEPGERKFIDLTLNTELGDAGTYNYTISTSSDSLKDSLTLTAVDTGGLTTSIDAPPSKTVYTVGNSISVTASVRNDASSSKTPEVAINIRNSTGIVDSYSPSSTSSLSSGETANYTTSFGTSNYKPGDYTILSKTQDDQFEIPISIVADNGIRVDNVKILNKKDEVKRNGTLRLNAKITNTGASSVASTLTATTTSGNSAESVNYAIKPAKTKKIRVSLPISPSEPTGVTEVIVDSGDITKKASFTITE